MANLLIVDDDAHIRDSLRDRFVARGHDVSTAVDGKDALVNVVTILSATLQSGTSALPGASSTQLSAIFTDIATAASMYANSKALAVRKGLHL